MHENETRLLLPNDLTPEEGMFLDLVRQRMLMKLSDRRKWLFVYIFEMGHSQKEAAEVLGVNEPNVSRQLKRIREILTPFKQGYGVKKDQ